MVLMVDLYNPINYKRREQRTSEKINLAGGGIGEVRITEEDKIKKKNQSKISEAEVKQLQSEKGKDKAILDADTNKKLQTFVNFKWK